MRKFIKGILIALVVVACGVGAFFYFGHKMVRDAVAEYDAIRPVDLRTIPDGIYRGSSGEFIVWFDLNVTVADHKITGIQILNQINGGGKYKAADVIPRILDRQTMNVDTVSGATISSKSIMTAVYKAVNQLQ